MSQSNNQTIAWLSEVEEHDYPAAESYLQLVFPEDRAADMVNRLRNASIVTFKARDVFRASRLAVQGISPSRVERDLKKIRKGISLSPILLVRDDRTSRLVVADGYHRLCASFAVDEEALIHCKII